jgi:hypothetical protein
MKRSEIKIGMVVKLQKNIRHFYLEPAYKFKVEEGMIGLYGLTVPHEWFRVNVQYSIPYDDLEIDPDWIRMQNSPLSKVMEEI